MTARELARLLHVSPAWVTEQARRGDLPGYRIGDALRFDRHEVAVWLTSKATRPAVPTNRSARLVLRPRASGEAPPAPVRLETAVDAAAVAEEFGVPATAVRGWVSSGLLPGVIAGRSCRVDLDALQQWRAIVASRAHLRTLSPGRARTMSVREVVERELLRLRGIPFTVKGYTRRGGQVPRWGDLLPSGRDVGSAPRGKPT